ncbi:hypothetical protein SAMN05421823_105235 [Catalinimonas alkaloidigena]|uniref:Lipoprotein n=1 Tax=Catalinimonas alkaloidigena TaxID=1075417 RepID=A0A1G9J878_9BACT|nr:hypothetical protein [Catalinimonas alkaloidigena]SDL33698.1 hypothetical protein SAMN05421823_105235 [Catalinimonas alkaloidigena]
MRRELRQIFFLMLCTLLFSACVRKVCPAYQSAFIMNGRVQREQFSLFEGDSTPRSVNHVQKNRYLVIEHVSKRKKEKMLNSIRAEHIFPDQMETGSDSTLIATDSTEDVE